MLVLRGDGLTTTSIETLAGRRIESRLQGQRRVRLETLTTPDRPSYTGVSPEVGVPLADIMQLEAAPEDELLVRRVHLTDPALIVFAVGEVLAVLDRLPPDLVETLSTSTMPLGRALVGAGIPVVRQMCSWGNRPAGPFASALGPGLTATSLVPCRTYRMVSMTSGKPLTVVVEWFAPRLFQFDGGRGRPRLASNPHLARWRMPRS
jgi:chorismate-pyruvate lyase